MEYIFLLIFILFVAYTAYRVYKNRERVIPLTPVVDEAPNQPPQEGPYQWVYYDNVGFQENTDRFHECDTNPKYPYKPCTMNNVGEMVEIEPCFEDENIVLTPYWKCEDVENK